jgi:hypothetical protein
MVNLKNADQARNSLCQVMLLLLREKKFAPEQLERCRLDIEKSIVRTPYNVSAFEGLKKIEKGIRDAHSEDASETIITAAIAQACSIFQTEQQILGEATSSMALAMFGASVARCQFAVGHGGFHAGRIQVLRSRFALASSLSSKSGDIETVFDQAYVYDCGSEHLDAFAEALQAYRKDYAEQLEVLFVSHLHADHINGLDRLLGYKIPRIVVLPYLDLEDIACIALHDFESGKFSGTYRDYIHDPVAWWRDHGVDTVIFIEPGGDDGVAPDSPLPDRPIVPGGPLAPMEWDWTQPQARLTAILQKPIGPVPSDLKPVDPAPSDPDARKLGQSALLAGPGSLFRLEWRHDPRDVWRSGDWCLVPYVHPVQDVQRAAFRAAILAHLKLSIPAPSEFRERILGELTSPKQAKALTNIYNDHFARNHNAISMSLYSGPAMPRGRPEGAQDWHSKWNLPERYRARRNLKISSGWLSTGDSMLKQQKRRIPWRQFYSRFQASIGTLTLPHHGSIHNFDDEILAWDELHLALATTVKREARVAEIDKTLQSVKAKGKLGIVVDDQPTTSVACVSERLFVV